MSDTADTDLERFTVKQGDLEPTQRGSSNPHGYSFNTVDGEVIYYDDDGNPVNPEFRPITEADIEAATRIFKMDTLSAASLAALIERCLGGETFADTVIVKAAGRVLEKTSQG